MRRNLVVLAGIVMLAVSALPAVAQETAFGAKAVQRSEFNSYIVIMQADPLAVTEGDNLDTNRARNRGQQLRQSHGRALRDAGVNQNRLINQYVHALNGFSVNVGYNRAVELAATPGVAMVLPDVLRQPQTDASPDFLGLTGGNGAWNQGYDGTGVVVGIIDTGIWPEHPSFANDGMPAPPTGTLPCEFGNTAHNPNDAPFSCNNKLIGARQMLATYRAVIGAQPSEFNSARDDNGHGTHTASTAAGNGNVDAEVLGIPRGSISGIAPRAHVIAYKGLGTLGGFTSDLAAAIDQAVEDGVDVINYSIGGGAGAPGADEIAFLFAADAGVFSATSAGNSGPGASTVGNPGTMPWITTVGANTQSRFFQGTVELGNDASYAGASITAGTDWAPLVDAAAAGGDLCVPGTLTDAVEGAIVLCRRGVIGRVAKSQAVEQAGGVGMIMFENSDAGNLFSDTHFVPSVHVDNTPGLAIKSYIGGASEPTARIVAEQISDWPYAPSMTDFSSRGPNAFAADIIKPDITAPGIQILAGNSPFPGAGAVAGQLFQAIAGTSMSSPHIAGVFALLKQANPGWSPAAARSALMTTADPDVLDNDRTSQAGPFAMGAGHARLGSPVRKGSAFQPGLVYNAGFNDYLGFLCDAAPEVFANPAATCAALAGLGFATEAINLNLPSIGISQLAGSQTVRRTVTSVAQENGLRTYRVAADAPAGYEVSVSPSTLRLRPGQSASYEVTITNVSAPLGQWRSGSLSWRDTTGLYNVRSPIAVRAIEFSSPAEVTGSGVDGSASFDVKFGYTGSYTAAAHGLVPATITSDTVVQDPDQTFNPADGFSNLHQFNLTGAAHFRIAMPPEATEPNADLDIFVYNPGGQLVASSTAGGTNEQVDIGSPADGTWSVYVHGWQTVGPDSPYDLYTWVVSATPGGNLSVDSAPASATIGDVATIEVSWTGATAGQWHLGAVSHARNALADLGLTLVNVDNR